MCTEWDYRKVSHYPHSSWISFPRAEVGLYFIPYIEKILAVLFWYIPINT